ncbi:uncharacterized protein [Solanum tuberosum]|nr:PREDICTED: uncharacterized protein LOC107060724 [Solanum tuberosum]
MMGTEDKMLLCFCHWGRRTKMLPDGSISYGGGITDQFIVKRSINYNDFVKTVFDRLGIDPSDKMLHFTVNLDRSELIRLRDQEGVDTLLQCNDGFAHVYVSSLQEEPYSILPSGGAKKVELDVVSDSGRDTTPAGDDLESSLEKARFQSAGDSSKPLKKAMANQLAGGSEPQQKEAVGAGDQKLAGVTRSRSTSKSNIISDKDNSDFLQCRHPEFSDFFKHKAENCFAADQIWAVYDDVHDAMPRKYVRIRKVFGTEFKIRFRWLEPRPEEDQRECAWVKSGCGKFISGDSHFTFDRFFFSHQMHCEKGTSDMYILYPRKGETWALFKARDILWSPQSHSEHKYEVVEILSDYVKNAGVKVGYLDKVTGFAGVFQRTKLSVAGSFFIKPNELYKFSHRILSFKMIGTEGTGVPAGSFELDTASLPLDPNDIWYPEKVKERSGLAKSEPVENVLSAVTPVTRGKSRTSKHATTPPKSETGSSKRVL